MGVLESADGPASGACVRDMCVCANVSVCVCECKRVCECKFVCARVM